MSNYPYYIVDDIHVVTALIGGCAKAGDEWILPEGKTLPSQEEIDAKREELKAEYDEQAYARARRPLYPDIGDQLDDLYKQGAFSDEMAAKIKKVKDDNPKPS